MITLKLQRIGRKGQPSYRLVVAEKRSKLGAPPVEDLGFYNPFSKKFQVKKERITYWISKGAQTTATMHNLLVRHGVVRAVKKMAIRLKKKVEKPAA